MFYTNPIVMKNIIISKKAKKKEKQLIIENVIELVKVAKMSNLINFNGKYMQAINSANINITRD